MDIFGKIKEVSIILDEIDDYSASMPETLSYYDNKVSDLYHKLEDMNLTVPKCYKYCKELKQVLNERRKLKIDIAIMQVIKDNKTKLISTKDNRKILLSNLGTTSKKVSTKQKPKIYTEEELIEKIGV